MPFDMLSTEAAPNPESPVSMLGSPSIFSPNPAYDDAAILKAVNDAYAKYKRKKWIFERTWYRNFLYLAGQQWIIWDEVDNKWRKRRLKDWVPTPVTNIFASSGARLVAMLSRIEPNWIFVPASSNPEDQIAARNADALEEIIAEDNNTEYLRDEIARWLVYTGNFFTICDVDPQTNRAYTDIVTPFEVYADLTIPELENHSDLLIINRRDKDYIKKLYGVEVSEAAPSDMGLQYLEALAYMSQDSQLSNKDFGVSTDHQVARATIFRYFKRPDKDYPDGLYAVTAGEDNLLEAATLPKTKENDSIFPITHFKFDPVPGSFFGRTPMNDIAVKQSQRNKIESLIELIILRMASPIWLLPSGVTVRGFTGEPGAVLKWDAIGDKSQPPNRIPGEQVPMSVFNFLEKIDKDVEELVATVEVLKGQSPYSGAPGVVITQLIEQGMTRFGPALRNIAEGWRKWMKIQIELFRLYSINPRTIKIFGNNKQWKIESLSSANFLNAIDVRIESDSTFPRSEQVESAKLMATINTGMIDMADPINRMKVFKKLHMNEFIETTDGDLIDITREHDILMQSGQIQVKPFIDNHPLHMEEHRKLAKSEEGMQLIGVLGQHIQEHQMQMSMEMAPPMPMVGAPQPQAGVEKPGAMVPPEGSNIPIGPEAPI